MKFCKKCIMTITRPEQVFDDEGVCNTCVSVSKKREINWDDRAQQFEKVLSKYRSDGSKYDCIIPVNGGKYS